MAVLGFLAYCLGYYCGLTLALYMLSFIVPKAAFAARCLASYLSLLIAAGFGVLMTLGMRLVGHGQSAQWAAGRVFAFLMAITTGVTFSVHDPARILETIRPAVFVGNHQTELDVLMLGRVFPPKCSITAKSSLRKIPVLGWFMALSKSIFLDRANSRISRHAMSGAAEQMRQMRQSVFMFPEGTRSYARDPTLLPFKKGAFHLAVQAQVPIVPVVTAHYSHILWPKGFVFNSGNIPVKVLDPIPTTGLTPVDVEELTRTTREIMLKELLAMTVEVRGNKHARTTGELKENGVGKASGFHLKARVVG